MLCAGAQASPLFEFQCGTNFPVGPLPETIEYRYTIRRHWHDTEPLTESSAGTWGRATFSSGEFEVEVPLISGGVIREQATAIESTLIDGYNGFGDELEDMAVSTSQEERTEGFWIRDFGFYFSSEDGSALDTHLEFPKSFELADFDTAKCVVFWRDGRDLSPQCAPAQDCNIGFTRGDALSVTALPHLHDHEGNAFQINPGLNDAWVNEDAPLQGLFITYYPVLDVVFLAWFTFDTEIPDDGTIAYFGAVDQRWITALGPVVGSSAKLNAELTTGGRFHSAEPLATQNVDFGTIDLDFSDCDHGHVRYAFPVLEMAGEFDIARAVPGSTALCDALSADAR